jgi:hypothetical protein
LGDEQERAHLVCSKSNFTQRNLSNLWHGVLSRECINFLDRKSPTREQESHEDIPLVSDRKFAG